METLFEGPRLQGRRLRQGAGGFVLGPAQLDASADPSEAALVCTPAAGARLGVGQHVLRVEIADAVRYEAPAVTVTLEVRRRVPVITWATPGEAVDAGEGIVLDGSTLNAVVHPAGLPLVYTPDAGTRLGAGIHVLQVRCDGDANHRRAVTQVTLVIQPAEG